MQHLRKRRLVDKIATITLLIAGYFGALFSIISLLVQLIKLLAPKGPAIAFLNQPDPLNFILLTVSVLLFIVSLLAVGIGLERSALLEDTQEEAQQRHGEVLQAISQIQRTVEQDDLNLVTEIEQVHQTLMSATIAVKPLIGPEAVYEEATRLTKACKGSEIIRSTAVPDPAYVSVYHSNYIEALARAIGQGKQKKRAIVYRLLMGFRPNEKGEPSLTSQEIIRERRRLFRQHEALDRLEIKYVENYWPLNFLIIGTEHIIIAFPTFARDGSIRSGIRISQKDFVESIVRWFDEYLWSQAKIVKWTGEVTPQ